jgi:two-component system response regulator AtoC
VPGSLNRILVVDDEENLRHLLTLVLERAGYRVRTATDGRAALDMLEDVDAVLCDVRMPVLDGLGFLAALPAGAPPVIVMSAYGSQETALEAVRRGAWDFVSKPFSADEIVFALRKLEERETLAAERSRLAVENARLTELSGQPVEGFVGRSAPVRDLMRVLTRVAPHTTTVLLTGESGTGKEVLARAIHRLSPRASGPWVAVNCAAIPESLLESELFGHQRGAFTGAVTAHAGLFEQAHGGTLFLDEIGDLPLPLQAKLLRVLQEGVIRRLGATRDTPVDVRIVAATAQPLAAPRFRDDLYYRLAVVHLQVPSLRARREDVPLLVDHLLDGLCSRLRIPRPSVDGEALRALVRHPWPGNVRQLENALERALLVCDGSVLREEDLPADTRVTASASTDPDDLSVPRRTAALERELILAALGRTEGNKAAAARLLDISYKALLYKIRDHGIEA